MRVAPSQSGGRAYPTVADNRSTFVIESRASSGSFSGTVTSFPRISATLHDHNESDVHPETSTLPRPTLSQLDLQNPPQFESCPGFEIRQRVYLRGPACAPSSLGYLAKGR